MATIITDTQKLSPKEYQRQYYLAHAEEKKQKSREWYRNNPDKKKQKRLEYCRNNIDTINRKRMERYYNFLAKSREDGRRQNYRRQGREQECPDKITSPEKREQDLFVQYLIQNEEFDDIENMDTSCIGLDE